MLKLCSVAGRIPETVHGVVIFPAYVSHVLNTPRCESRWEERPQRGTRWQAATEGGYHNHRYAPHIFNRALHLRAESHLKTSARPLLAFAFFRQQGLGGINQLIFSAGSKSTSLKH